MKIEPGAVLYCAVVLTEESRQRLIDRFNLEGLQVLAHHMTIRFGQSLEECGLAAYEGTKVVLRGLAVGSFPGKAMAVSVDGFKSWSETPHITVAVNADNGGKPAMSNLIQYWMPWENPMELEGTVCNILKQ